MKSLMKPVVVSQCSYSKQTNSGKVQSIFAHIKKQPAITVFLKSPINQIVEVLKVRHGSG